MLLTAKYYMGNFSIFAKGGYAYVRQETKFEGGQSNGATAGVPDSSISFTTRKSKWKPMVAVGLGYDVMDNLAITAQYSAMMGKNANDVNNWDVNEVKAQDVFSTYTITAGVTYTFGM